jgi:predicted GH43/DUF377 family glycosyl hydrolase
MKAFVQLKKVGDILSILPILYAQAPFNEKVPLIVSKECASLLDGVSYVEPIVYAGSSEDLRGAIAFAKKSYSHVINLQMHGIEPVRTTPSFQLDQYARVGMVDKFHDLPLVIDQRNPDRESELVHSLIGDQPVILFADHSQSSPFLPKEELAKLLRKNFPGHKVIRLSEVRCSRFFDMLGLYDAAKCLVTVETSHLHLSKASAVPVFALAAGGWRGSAYSPRFKFFMRYAEWDRRKADLIKAVRDFIEGKESPKVVTENVPDFGYNLSMLEHNGITLKAWRVHTRNDWRTELFINGEKMKVDSKLKDFSIEDARIFVYQNRFHAAYVVSTTINGQFRSYMAYGKIEGDTLEHIRINIVGNDHTELQKNWVPFVHENKLYFIYGINGKEQIVLQVDGDRVVSRHNSPAPEWDHGQIRGGVILPYKNSLLRFFHSRVTYPDKTLRYFVGASILESKPPFRTLKVCSRPILEGHELFVSGARFWKSNVVFPLGATVLDDKITLSMGVNDSQCATVELEENDLNL